MPARYIQVARYLSRDTNIANGCSNIVNISIESKSHNTEKVRNCVECAELYSYTEIVGLIQNIGENAMIKGYGELDNTK